MRTVNPNEHFDEHDNPRVTPLTLWDNIQLSAAWRAPFERDWIAAQHFYSGKVSRYQFTHVSDNVPTWHPEGRRSNVASVNLVKQPVDIYLAATSMRDPKAYIHPRFPQAAEYAEAQQAAGNYFWRTQRVSQEFDLAQIWNAVCGHGWVRVSWYDKRDTRRQSDATRESEISARVSARERLLAVNPQATTKTEKEIRRNVNDEMDNNPILMSHRQHPVARHLNIYDLFVDPAATNMRDARWIAQRAWYPKHVLLADKFNDPAGLKELRDLASTADVPYTTSIGQQFSSNSNESQNRNTPDVHWVEVYEYHDMSEGTWCQFVAGAENWLKPPVVSPYKDSLYRSPFEQLRHTEIIGMDGRLSFYPQGIVHQLIPINWAFNELTTKQLKMANMLKPGWFVRGDAAERSLRNQLVESDDDGGIVTVPGTEPLDQIVQPANLPQIPGDLFNLQGQQERFVGLTSGVNDIDRGTSTVNRRSAYEVSELQGGGQSTTEKHIRKTQQSAANVIGRFVLLAGRHLTKETAARIIGPDNQEAWVQFDRSRLLGEFDVEIEHGSMAPRNDAQKRQDALTLFQTLAPIAAQPQSPVSLPGLVQMVINTFDVEDPSSLMNELTMDPAQQQQDIALQQQAEQELTPPGTPAA